MAQDRLVIKAVLVFTVVLALVGCNSRAPKPRAEARKQSHLMLVSDRAKPSAVVYPYSVVPGGVETAEDVAAAAKANLITARHYSGIRVATLEQVMLGKPAQAYVSYRKNGRIYWTRRPVYLPAGEKLLTNGTDCIRGRCGNRISFTPKTPVIERAEFEPPPEMFNTPQAQGLTIDEHAPWLDTAMVFPMLPLPAFGAPPNENPRTGGIPPGGHDYGQPGPGMIDSSKIPLTSPAPLVGWNLPTPVTVPLAPPPAVVSPVTFTIPVYVPMPVLPVYTSYPTVAVVTAVQSISPATPSTPVVFTASTLPATPLNPVTLTPLPVQPVPNPGPPDSNPTPPKPTPPPGTPTGPLAPKPPDLTPCCSVTTPVTPPVVPAGAEVPEPSTLVLMLAGVGVTVAARRFRR